MLHALLVLASEEAEPSKTAFYVLGGAAAVWAVLLAAFGLSRPQWPSGEGGARGVMGVSALVVAVAVAAAIFTG